MEDLTSAKRMVRFGLFEVDFASQELRKSGIKIKIQDQPFQILALLLERPGQNCDPRGNSKAALGRGHFCRF